MIDVFQALREHGTLTASVLQERIFEGYTVQWAGARPMWYAIDCYLEAVPGIEKSGYGEQTYADANEDARDVLGRPQPVDGLG